mgnify:CR=1 FL=1
MEAVVTGSVQGVRFRVYAQDAATKLGITGWVRNEPDGSVLVIAQGTQDILKEFVEYLHEGSLHARVESVSVDWQTIKQPLNRRNDDKC